MSADSQSPAPVKEGDILASKYRVEKVLGVGGMGVVVAAHHVDLDEKVALKFLLPAATTNGELVGRFLREARASVKLKGAHVAKVLDVGRLDDGCPYIVMEFLEGRDLSAVLKASDGGPVPTEDAVSYVLHASLGLAEAHSLGIVHRDLKPGNLFLTRGVDGKPLVKVLDFGISKTTDTSIAGDAKSLTKTEMLLGSPLYMSPEQMRSSKHVDARADLWALGAIAYELLSGKVPFEAETILELCFMVAQEKPKNLKELRPDLPDKLCAAVMRCLEKDPAARYGNVGELSAALEPFGPARDRGIAVRALDVLGTGKRPPMRSDPELPETGAAGAVGATSAGAAGEAAAASAAGEVPDALASAPTLALPATTGSQLAPQESEPDVAPASSAWGGTRSEPKPKAPPPRSRGWMAAAAGVVVAGAIAGVAFSRSGKGDGAEGAAPASSPVPSPNMITQTSASAASPAAVTSAAAGPAETAAAAAPATATALATASAAPTGSMHNTSVATVRVPTAVVAPVSPDAVALTAGKGTAGKGPGAGGPGAGAGATKPAKPAASGAATAAATAASPPPASSGFIRVRE